MTTLKALIIIFFSFFYVTANFGQTGSISIQTFEDDYFSAYLYKGDSLIQQKNLSDIYYIDFDSLKTGCYKVTVITESGIEFSYFPINVKTGHKTIYDFSLPYIWSKKISDTIKYEKFETAFNFLTNLKSKGTSPLINRNYQIGITQGFIFNKKNLGTILSLGSSFSYTDFQNDTSFYNTISNIKNERYFGWNLDACIMGRFSTFDMRKDYKKGAYLDIGVSYHFPLLFRHVYNIENRKHITKKIHNYKNLTPIFRIGYNGVAITYQYQLLDYIKESFPQNPKHTVGLTFLIEG